MLRLKRNTGWFGLIVGPVDLLLLAVPLSTSVTATWLRGVVGGTALATGDREQLPPIPTVVAVALVVTGSLLVTRLLRHHLLLDDLLADDGSLLFDDHRLVLDNSGLFHDRFAVRLAIRLAVRLLWLAVATTTTTTASHKPTEIGH